MPRLDGKKLISLLRKRRDYLPIIGITGVNELRKELRSLDSGAYYYMQKPLPDFESIDNLVDNAVRFGRQERMRLRKRGEIARMVRAHILATPTGPPKTLSYEIGLNPMQSEMPSGDFVEHFERSGNELLFYVADASGHFDIVATFTACLSSLALHRSHHNGHPSVAEIILAIDRALDSLRRADALDESRFLTFFIGVIDLASGQLTYVNAGHPAALLLRPAAEGEATRVDRLAQTGASVGHISLLKLPPPQVESKKLKPGDIIFLYTDGANELLQGDDKMEDGIARLSALVEPLCDRSPQEVVNEIGDNLRAHAGAGGLPDDTTLMAIRLRKA